MADIDQEFVEFVVRSLVGEPDKVSIERTIDEKGVLLELTVAPDDLGRVIGKRGNTAQSIRTLLRALGTKNDARYNLKIIDVNEGERPPRREHSQDDSNQASEPTPTTSQVSSSDDSNDGNADTGAATAATTTASAGASRWSHLSSSADSDDNSEDSSDDSASSDDEQQQNQDDQSTEENSVVEKTKQELADLDDLDI